MANELSEKETMDMIVGYLKYGYSNRKLDEIYYPRKVTNGKNSWRILNGKGLKPEHKGSAFIFTVAETKKIFREFERKGTGLAKIVKKRVPEKLVKYEGSAIYAQNEKKCHDIIAGNLRNLTQSFFKTERTKINECQFENCNTKKLETVHVGRDRPEIFMDCLKNNRTETEGGFRYGVLASVREYLNEHGVKDAIAFLCKAHHDELDNGIKKNNELNETKRKKELASFKRKIDFSRQ